MVFALIVIQSVRQKPWMTDNTRVLEHKVVVKSIRKSYYLGIRLTESLSQNCYNDYYIRF
jgi:hypothetical protein